MNSGSEVIDFQYLHTHLICIRGFKSIKERTLVIRSSERLTGDSVSGRAGVVPVEVIGWFISVLLCYEGFVIVAMEVVRFR